mgnify:FL=1
MIYSQCVLEWVLILRSALCGENFGNKLGLDYVIPWGKKLGKRKLGSTRLVLFCQEITN